MPRALLITIAAMIVPISLVADVLVLRDGTRVQGELITVRGGVIEFEEQSFGGRGRIVRVDREEVVRIEFDNRGGGGGGGDAPPIANGLGIRVRSSGRLYLGINDEVLTDNSGAFRVTVYY